jgi:ferredoxin
MEIMIARFDRHASLLMDGGYTMMKGISGNEVAPRAAILRVRQEYCQGHARCSAIAPQLFVQDGLGPVRVIGDGTIPPGLEKQARRAIACCPEQAIEILYN